MISEKVQVIEGNLVAQNLRFSIVAGRFNNFVTSNLIQGAIDTLVRHGVSEEAIELVYVPGAFEIPLICKELAQRGDVDAIITVGAVIRGSTNHFDLICNELSTGIARVSEQTSIPVLFGVVTAENIEQAIERSGSKAGNKGADAALAAIEMVNLLKELRAKPASTRSKMSAVS